MRDGSLLRSIGRELYVATSSEPLPGGERAAGTLNPRLALLVLAGGGGRSRRFSALSWLVGRGGEPVAAS